MNTSSQYLVLFNVDFDQITPLNLLPLPSLISFDVVWIKVYLLAGAVFIDLRKAFDSVDLLINKLESYGLKNTELNWSSKAIYLIASKFFALAKRPLIIAQLRLGFPKDQS